MTEENIDNSEKLDELIGQVIIDAEEKRKHKERSNQGINVIDFARLDPTPKPKVVHEVSLDKFKTEKDLNDYIKTLNETYPTPFLKRFI